MSKKEHSVENDLGEISSCGCGGVNLVMGAVSFHFAADEVQALCELAHAGLNMVATAEKRKRTRPGRSRKSKYPRTYH